MNSRTPHSPVRSLLFSLVIVLASTQPVQAQGTPTVRVRGEIMAVNPGSLVVKTRTGETLSIAVKPDQGVAAVKAVPMSSIKQGVFIGTATKTAADGSLEALEVVVFPEAGRGTGEGHYGWDLLPGSSMTNANVDSVIEAASGRDLTLSYKGGSQKVTVPPGVPIVTVVPASREDLVVGKKVFIVVTPNEANEPVAVRIIVEKDGVAPPM